MDQQLLVINPFTPCQPNVAFHIETSHLICCANQMNGFYMECDNRLKWVKPALNLQFIVISLNNTEKSNTTSTT